MRNFRVPGAYPEPYLDPDRSLTGVWDFLFRVPGRGSEFPGQGPVRNKAGAEAGVSGT